MTLEEVEREEIARDLLIVTALSASTSEQCARAEGLIIAWMKKHPRDFGILVAMISDRFDRPAGEAPATR